MTETTHANDNNEVCVRYRGCGDARLYEQHLQSGAGDSDPVDPKGTAGGTETESLSDEEIGDETGGPSESDSDSDADVDGDGDGDSDSDGDTADTEPEDTGEPDTGSTTALCDLWPSDAEASTEWAMNAWGFERSDTIFEGRIEEIRDGESTSLAIVTVEKVWFGMGHLEGHEVMIVTPFYDVPISTVDLYHLKLAYPCGDSRLEQVGSERLAGLVEPPGNYDKETAIAEGALFLVPGLLVPPYYGRLGQRF